MYRMTHVVCSFFFFFQAEDGIRDLTVTGVQTCALPISLTFSFLSYLVAIPSAVKVFNWTSTLYKGSISWDTPMIYALGFIGLFLIGEIGRASCRGRV